MGCVWDCKYMGTAFDLIACIFIGVTAIAAAYFIFDAKAWTTKGLKRGDLHSLTDVASGLRPDGLTPGQARRLQARGLVRNHGNGYFRATIKGKLAVRIRRAIRRTA